MTENPNQESEKPEIDYNQLFRLELGFFEVLKLISKRTKIYLTIPETFIFGFGFTHPTLLCTDYDTGELHIREGITRVGIYESCGFFEEMNRLKGAVPIAVHKLASTTYFKDTCKMIFTPTEAHTIWGQYYNLNRAQVLQRFILSGLTRASLIKTTWNRDKVRKQLYTNNLMLKKPGPRLMDRSNSRKSVKRDDSQTDMKQNQRSAFFVLTKAEGVTATELSISHVIDSKTMYLINLLEKYYLTADLKVASLEVDYIQDEKGLW